MWHHSHVVIGQKPSSQEGRMGWRIVMVEQPCVVPPLIRSLPSHVLPQTFQNFDVEYSINPYQEEQILCEQFPSDRRNKSALT